MSLSIALNELLDRPVPMHPALRVGLAVVVVLGGLCFVAFGTGMLFFVPRAAIPHPQGALLLMISIIVLGCGFLHIGFCLMRPMAESGNLLGSSARKVYGIAVGALAVAEAAFAWHMSNVGFALGASAMASMACWLFRPVAAKGPDVSVNDAAWP